MTQKAGDSPKPPPVVATQVATADSASGDDDTTPPLQVTGVRSVSHVPTIRPVRAAPPPPVLIPLGTRTKITRPTVPPPPPPTLRTSVPPTPPPKPRPSREQPVSISTGVRPKMTRPAAPPPPPTLSYSGARPKLTRPSFPPPSPPTLSSLGARPKMQQSSAPQPSTSRPKPLTLPSLSKRGSSVTDLRDSGRQRRSQSAEDTRRRSQSAEDSRVRGRERGRERGRDGDRDRDRDRDRDKGKKPARSSSLSKLFGSMRSRSKSAERVKPQLQSPPASGVTQMLPAHSVLMPRVKSEMVPVVKKGPLKAFPSKKTQAAAASLPAVAGTSTQSSQAEAGASAPLPASSAPASTTASAKADKQARSPQPAALGLAARALSTHHPVFISPPNVQAFIERASEFISRITRMKGSGTASSLPEESSVVQKQRVALLKEADRLLTSCNLKESDPSTSELDRRGLRTTRSGIENIKEQLHDLMPTLAMPK